MQHTLAAPTEEPTVGATTLTARCNTSDMLSNVPTCTTLIHYCLPCGMPSSPRSFDCLAALRFGRRAEAAAPPALERFGPNVGDLASGLAWLGASESPFWMRSGKVLFAFGASGMGSVQTLTVFQLWIVCRACRRHHRSYRVLDAACTSPSRSAVILPS